MKTFRFRLEKHVIHLIMDVKPIKRPT